MVSDKIMVNQNKENHLKCQAKRLDFTSFKARGHFKGFKRAAKCYLGKQMQLVETDNFVYY